MRPKPSLQVGLWSERVPELVCSFNVCWSRYVTRWLVELGSHCLLVYNRRLSGLRMFSQCTAARWLHPSESTLCDSQHLCCCNSKFYKLCSIAYELEQQHAESECHWPVVTPMSLRVECGKYKATLQRTKVIITLPKSSFPSSVGVQGTTPTLWKIRFFAEYIFDRGA